MGGEDRDLRFGMRRVLRDELLAQDDEEAEAYVHHGTEDAGDVGEAGVVHGSREGERLAWSRAVPASAGRIVSHTLRTSGITALLRNRSCASSKAWVARRSSFSGKAARLHGAGASEVLMEHEVLFFGT